MEFKNIHILRTMEKEEIIEYIEDLEDEFINHPINDVICWLEDGIENLRDEIKLVASSEKYDDLMASHKHLSKNIDKFKQGEKPW